MTGTTRLQTIEELQTAVDHACQHGDYQTTITLLTEALQQNHLTGEQRCELLKRRAAVYALVEDTAAQIADLQAANELLSQQLDDHDVELILLNSIAQALTEQHDIQDIYDLVGDKLREIFQADATFIAFHDDEKTNITAPYYRDNNAKQTLIRPYGVKGIYHAAVETGKPHLVGTQEEAVKLGIYPVASPGAESDLNESVIVVPIMKNGRVIGATSVQSYKQYAYDESDVRLLTTLTNSMSVALENARLFDETQRLLKETEERNAELAVINSIQQGIAAELDFQGIIDLVGDELRRLFNEADIGIYWYDQQANLVEYLYLYEHGERVAIPARPPQPDGVMETLIKTRRPLILNNQTDLEAFGMKALPGTKAGKALASVPIIGRDRVLGGIGLENFERENAFGAAELRLLTTVAHSMGTALENARLFDETQRLLKETEERNAELAIINSVQEGLAMQLDFQGIVELIGEKVGGIFAADTTEVLMYDVDRDWISNTYYVDRGERIPLSDRPAPRPSLGFTVLDTRKPLILGTSEEAAKYGAIRVPRVGAEVDENESYLGVPILTGNKPIGLINVQSYQQNAYSQDDLRLLQTLANSMSVALENARLFDETQRLLKETEQRNAELAIINRVQEGLAAELDMQAIYDLVGDQIRDIFAAQSVIIVGHDKANERAEFHYVYSDSERVYPAPIAITETPMGQIMLRDKKPVKLDTEADFRALKLQTIEGTQGNSKSGLFVPLLVGNEVRWGISLQNREREYAFSDADVRLLTTLANSMSVALENARLFAETQHHAREMAALTEVGRDISATLDLPTVLERIASHARELLAASDSAVFLLDETEQNMQAFVALGPIATAIKEYTIQPGEGILGDVWQRGEAEVLNVANKDPRARQIPGTAVQSEEKMMVVPLLAGRNVTGLMAVWRTEGNLFREIELRFLEGLARQAAIAIENARLFDETQRLLEETQQRNAELAVINSVQQGLVAELDIQAIYDLVGEQIRDIFDAQVVTLNRFDHALQRNIYCCAFEKGERLTIEPQPFTPIIDNFIKQGQPLLLNEGVERFIAKGGATIAAGEMPRSFLAVPLWSGNQVSGSITLQDVDHEHAFTEADLRLLSTLAASTSVALESARLYNEMEAARAAAVKANESKSAFLANVSHELRTPLTSILGFTRIVQKRLDERIFPHVAEDDGRAQRALKQVDENLNIVLGEGERLTTLINNVLDLEKIDAGQVEWRMEPLSVADVVERGLQATAALVEQAGLTLEQDVPTDLPLINGDKDKLVQVVINLIANAVKFTPTGKITCRATLVDGEVQVSIQDTGVGIAAVDLEAVFEKFKQVGDTLTEKPTGTGLGLPICKEIVERHDGRIWAASVLGQGSTFTFALPVGEKRHENPHCRR